MTSIKKTTVTPIGKKVPLPKDSVIIDYDPDELDAALDYSDDSCKLKVASLARDGSIDYSFSVDIMALPSTCSTIELAKVPVNKDVEKIPQATFNKMIRKLLTVIEETAYKNSSFLQQDMKCSLNFMFIVNDDQLEFGKNCVQSKHFIVVKRYRSLTSNKNCTVYMSTN